MAKVRKTASKAKVTPAADAKSAKAKVKGKRSAKASAADDEEDEGKGSEKEFKYGVQDLADMLEIKPASVRVALRNHEIEKAGKSYGWNTQKELKEVADTIRSNRKEAA